MDKISQNDPFLFVSLAAQKMYCYEGDNLVKTYLVSTGERGAGEMLNSYCTPRGWHEIQERIGLDAPENTVFVGRKPSGEIYSPELEAQCPHRDWILTRILVLRGLEPGRNQGGAVDSMMRYIYIHGTAALASLGKEPKSKGCIRMEGKDIIKLADWVRVGTWLCIE